MLRGEAQVLDTNTTRNGGTGWTPDTGRCGVAPVPVVRFLWGGHQATQGKWISNMFFFGGDWEDPTQNGQPVFPIIFAGKLRESAKVVSPRVAPVGAPTAFLEIDACEFAFREVGCISQKQVRERTACAHDPAFPGWAKFDHLLFSHGGHGSSFVIGA